MIRILSASEFTKLQNSFPFIPPKHAAIFSILMCCGLRVGELTQLRFSDIILVNTRPRELHVRASTSKSAVGRQVPIPWVASKFILAYLLIRFPPQLPRDAGAYLFPARTGTSHLGSRAVQSYVHDFCQTLLKKDVNPHLLRHTYATMMLKNTNTREVQLLLGHRRLTTTQIYTHPTLDDLTKSVDATFSRKKTPKK